MDSGNRVLGALGEPAMRFAAYFALGDEVPAPRMQVGAVIRHWPHASEGATAFPKIQGEINICDEQHLNVMEGVLL